MVVVERKVRAREILCGHEGIVDLGIVVCGSRSEGAIATRPGTRGSPGKAPDLICGKSSLAGGRQTCFSGFFRPAC